MNHDDPEDRLLSELADLAREDGAGEARFDERWDRLAAGTLAAEEEAELLALAESSPEAREAWEAFRPLGPEFQARVVERIAAGLPKKGWARILPFPPAFRIGGWVTAAAAAAAVFFVILRPAAPLPGYQMDEVSLASSEMRGEVVEDFAPGDRIEVGLRPATESRSGRLEARLFLLQGEELRGLDARKVKDDPGGAMKLAAELDPDLWPGDWTLLAVVGRPRSLPDPDELRSLAAHGEVRRRNWVAVSKVIRIQPRAP